MSNPDDREQRVRIRRAPKFSVFVVIGALVGVFISLVLTASFPIDPAVGFGPTFGYFAIYGFVGGILLGSIVALIFDRALRRGARTVPVTVDRLLVPDQEPAAAPDAAPNVTDPDHAGPDHAASSNPDPDALP